MKLTFFLTVAALAALLAPLPSPAGVFSPTKLLIRSAEQKALQQHRAKKELLRNINTNRHVTWRWEVKSGHHRTHARTIGWDYSVPLMRDIVHKWHDRAERARMHYLWHVEQQRRLQASQQVASTGYGVWDALANCEASGNWSTNTGNGFSGGLQFVPGTWLSHGGGKYAPYAYMATRDQQIVVAQSVLSSQGWGAWPVCSAKLGLG